MLELRPNCEYCDKDLPPESTEACICTFECTFCKQCVENLLNNVCPNCGGGFSPRPIRPSEKLLNNPSSTKRVNTKLTMQEITNFVDSIKDIKPENR